LSETGATQVWSVAANDIATAWFRLEGENLDNFKKNNNIPVMRPTFSEGRMYIRLNRTATPNFSHSAIAVIDTATGKKVANTKIGHSHWEIWDGYSTGRFFWIGDPTHQTTHICMFDANELTHCGHPEDPAGAKPWVPPHPQANGYDACVSLPIVDGRLFLRGDRIYCWDLRKPK